MNVIPHKTIKYNDPWIYTEDPPWTDLALRKNDPRQGHRLPQLIEPLKTWDIYRGDVVSYSLRTSECTVDMPVGLQVEVMVGKDKGKQGNVSAYIRELNAVFVAGLNMVRRRPVHRNITDNACSVSTGDSTGERWFDSIDFSCRQREAVDGATSSQVN